MMLTKMWLMFAATLFQNSLQASLVTSKFCSELPKPLNSSVQAAWVRTTEMKDMLAKTGAAVASACADVDGKSEIKDMGRYLISGFVNLRCLVVAHMKELSRVEIDLLNQIHILIAEITGNPLICLDFAPHIEECPKDMPQDLYTATSLLARILENLYMRVGSEKITLF